MSPVRVFGYGSLVWRPDFPFVDRRPATLQGWARRFWQGSPDHRGTVERPGRVVTLVPDDEAVTVGMVYTLPVDHTPEILAHLDHRERAGFERLDVDVQWLDGAGTARALVYRATHDNPWFLGPSPVDEIADHVVRSHGASGDNATYVLALADALAGLGAVDLHVHGLAEAVRARLIRDATPAQATPR